MRNKDIISYLGLWECIHNENFKGQEFDNFENEAGKNSFYMSPQKWIKETNAIGIILTCLIKSTSILLQSMGSSFKSTILALSRDVIFFVPAIIILANISGSIVTMLYSAIISAILSFLLAIILLKSEFKKLN